MVGHRVALHGVSQRVHSGPGSDRLRQVDGESRVDQGHPRGQVRGPTYVELDLPVWIGDDGPQSYLASGPGSCRDRDERWDAPGDRVVPELVLQDRPALIG